MFRQLQKLYNSVSDSGIRNHLRPTAIKSIKLVNQLSLMAALVSVLFMLMNPDIKPFPVRIAESSAPFIFLLIPLLNRSGWYFMARYCLYLVLNLYCFTTSVSMGISSGEHLYFIPIIAGTALVFNLQDKRRILPALIVPLLTILLLMLLDDRYAIDQQLYRQELKSLYIQNFLTTVLVSFVLAYWYYQITHQQQQELEAAVGKFIKLNRHLRLSEKKMQKHLLFSDKLMDQLTSSKDYFKSLLQNASDITAVVDGQGNLKYITPSFFRLTGFKPDDIIHKTVFDFVHPDDLPDAQERFQLNLSGKPKDDMFRLRYRKADGSYLYLEAKGTNMLHDKNVNGIVINSRNITDRLYYEREAVMKERNMRSILENNENRIWLVDRKYRLVDLNSSFAESFKATFDIELKRNVSIMEGLPLEEQQKWAARYEKAFAGVVETYIEQYPQSGGELRTFRISVYPIFEDGKVEQVTVFSTDITEQEQAKEAMRRAKEQAEEASRTKALFLSTMSHELRTPMNAVIGMTHLLLQESPKPEQVENLRILKFSAESLLALINDILDFSKIEAGKVRFEHVPFNLRQLMADLKGSMMVSATEKKISLELLLDADLPEGVIGDPLRLSQVLTNLMSNAIKFTEKGKVMVKLTLLRNTPENCLIEFTVSDSGIGIPLHMQEAVFDSFTQASNDTTRRFGGTGLGLAITRKLLELQGSKIMLKSVEGEGSTFTFRLQFGKEVNLLDSLKSASVPGLDHYSLKGYKILMVEDNPLNVFVGSRFLSSWGMKVTAAESGLTALRMLKESSYDLILMDLQMPEMDGFETASLIRQLEDPRLASVPILAISASSEVEIREKALSTGMDDFILKPFSPDELQQKLHKYLAAKPITE